MDQVEDSDFLITFCSILNSLTHQENQVCLEEVKKLTIDTEEKHGLVFDPVSDKVTDEPAISVQYALLDEHPNNEQVDTAPASGSPDYQNQVTEKNHQQPASTLSSVIKPIYSNDTMLQRPQAELSHLHQHRELQQAQRRYRYHLIYERFLELLLSGTEDCDDTGASDAWNNVEDSDEARTQDVLKKFRGILNKITPQKFHVLLDRIDKLPIDTEERLKQILDLVYDKAVDEPAFCVPYAKLCKHLSNLSIVKLNDEQKEEQVKFQKLLLSRCQKEFETDIYVDIDVAGREAAIEACEEADKRKVLVAEFEEEKRLARKKSLGNIKLIGELYKLEMMKGSIMVFCMHKLISELEEESLECLCTLLKTIGNQLEEECRKLGKSEEHLEPYFKRLEKIVRDKQTSSRIRFLIQDVLDMRRNGWKERKIRD
ncbi:Eukaryotic translation initiation factor 4 gamma 1 [Halotydeus destructor]|nr:Eukaryotic translation initiation factor 4 gamma 1 [Halotydeus destructor]